jgi:calcineurin-like phosphoesterase family protein
MSSNVYFTSDTHYGHEKIIDFESYFRPFDSIEEHDETLVDRHNSVVRPRDVVWYVGDVAWKRQAYNDVMPRLNGTKKLVLGNHDTFPSEVYLKYFSKVYGAVKYKNCMVTHIPIHPNNIGKRWLGNIHGHTHHNNVMIRGHWLFGPKKDPRYYNVSLEQHDLYPVPIEKILAHFNELS